MTLLSSLSESSNTTGARPASGQREAIARIENHPGRDQKPRNGKPFGRSRQTRHGRQHSIGLQFETTAYFPIVFLGELTQSTKAFRNLNAIRKAILNIVCKPS